MIAAATLADEGIRLDRSGSSSGALEKYEESQGRLVKVLARMPEDAPDKANVAENLFRLVARVDHLKNTSPDAVEPVQKVLEFVPLETLVDAAQKVPRLVTATNEAVDRAGGVKTMGAAMAVGAGLGFFMLGGAIGVLGGAALLGHMVTRQDKAGDVARAAGGVGLAAASRVHDLEEKHGISVKLAAAGTSAMEAAKQADEKYKITERIGEGVEAAKVKAIQLDQEHGIG